MGVESKFYAVRKYNFKSNKTGYDAAETIAILDACKMGYDPLVAEFIGLFDAKADFAISMYDYNPKSETVEYMDITEDRYGVPISYISDKEEGIRILKKIIKKDEYQRFKWLLKFLQMFKDDDDVFICLYQY